MPPDGDNIAIIQPVGIDQLLVDESTVFTFQIDQHKAAPQRVDFGVVTGDRRIIDHHVVVVPAADGQRCAFFKLILADGFIFII